MLLPLLPPHVSVLQLSFFSLLLFTELCLPAPLYRKKVLKGASRAAEIICVLTHVIGVEGRGFDTALGQVS